MLIDNFDKLRKIVKFKEGYFHLLYIIQRDKDHIDDGVYILYENMPSHTIRYWPITSMEDLDKIESDVKRICKETESRVYFVLNLTDTDDFNKCIKDNIKNVYDSKIVNKYTPSNVLYYYVGRDSDLDINEYRHLDLDDDLGSDEYVKLYTDILHEINPDIKIIDVFPTKTGKHLISTAFDETTYYEYTLDKIGIAPRVFKHCGVLVYLNLTD